MTSNFKIKDVSGWTMFMFGGLALLLGLLGPLRPEFLLSLLGFTVLVRATKFRARALRSSRQNFLGSELLSAMNAASAKNSDTIEILEF